MLPSLSIKNYRNLKNLEINSLKSVNLIAGKNNTGKTSLLEAISLYASKGSLQWINRLLNVRDEFYQDSKGHTTDNVKIYTSLFSDRIIDFSGKQRILIGPLLKNISEKSGDFLKGKLSIRFITLKEITREFIDSETNESYKFTQKEVVEEPDNEGIISRPALSIGFDSNVMIYEPINLNTFLEDPRSKPYNYQFVESQNINNNNDQLWDHIALSDKENYVVEALRIIEPGVDRITFIKNEYTDQRIAVVKIDGSPRDRNQSAVPLKSMGDGMNRILAIILALVNAENGFLLIDEFENGLHYTVQENLWQMIFKLAKKLNVQVFATTHSDDCIRAFAHVLHREGNQSEGQYFRLEKLGAEIKPVFYSVSELQVAANQYIETR